jgi:putative flippase GtrA
MTFLLYCICGGIGVSADYTTFYLLVTAGAWYQAANIAGYVAGTLVSFALNRAFTFKIKDKVGQRLTMFLAVAACGFGCSALLLWLLVKGIHLDPRIAKLFTLPIVVAIQYGLNRRFSFRATALPAGPIA